MFTPALAVLSIDPGYAKNITVYHVNEHKYGAIPVNMDTGDALGDMFFDMLEVIMYPVGCPNGTHTPSPSKFFNPCLNPEAGGEDLMVNKLCPSSICHVTSSPQSTVVIRTVTTF